MSDGCSEAYRAMAAAEDYIKRLTAIRTMKLDELCKFYNIEKTSNVMDVIDQVEQAQFQVDSRDYHESHRGMNPKYRLMILMPHAYQTTEAFSGNNLEEVCTRATAYLIWANTDLGKKAIERYLD